MNKKLIIIFLIVLLIIFILLSYKSVKKLPKVIINGKEIIVEIADSDLLRQKGLSNRKSLAENQGMLFIFPQKDYHSFWMKDMNFPLDFIWLDDEVVIDLTENVPVYPPLSELSPPIITPGSQANRVLEVNSGIIKKYNIRINDKVRYNLN